MDNSLHFEHSASRPGLGADPKEEVEGPGEELVELPCADPEEEERKFPVGCPGELELHFPAFVGTNSL